MRNSLTLIKKGAEANLYLTEWYGEKVIAKRRVPKHYRVTDLDDQIREYRTAHEAGNLFLARKFGVSTPIVLMVNEPNFTIIMEYIEGLRVKEALEVMSGNNRKELCEQIGNLVGRLHKNKLIHGDLTSSNMIISDNEKIFFIDFGLSFYSDKLEDMGVDLHLLKRALYSTHHKYAKKCFDSIRNGYRKEVGISTAVSVFRKTEQIGRRGRYFIERNLH